jgi:hypothetical protein
VVGIVFRDRINKLNIYFPSEHRATESKILRGSLFARFGSDRVVQHQLSVPGEGEGRGVRRYYLDACTYVGDNFDGRSRASGGKVPELIYEACSEALNLNQVIQLWPRLLRILFRPRNEGFRLERMQLIKWLGELCIGRLMVTGKPTTNLERR